MKGVLILSALLIHSAFASTESLFQYAVDIEEGNRVFLWLPHESEKIQAVLVMGTTSIEKLIAVDPRIRQVCAEHHVAIIIGMRGLEAFFTSQLLERFAEISGYEELQTAHLIFLGHSAGGPQANRLAMQFNERTIGLVLSRGAVPDVSASFPVLVMVGQYDEFSPPMRTPEGREPPWENVKDVLAGLRRQNPALRVSLAVEPGAGHFGYSDRNSHILALFLSKVVTSKGEPWVTPLDVRHESPPQPLNTYADDPGAVSLHPDREMAEAIHCYHADIRKPKKDQFLTWKDPHFLEAGARRFFSKLDFLDDPLLSFKVHPVYASTVPEYKEPRWPNQGEPTGSSGQPIALRVVSGPIEVVGGHVLRFRHDALNPAFGPISRLTWLAFSEGNDEYRYTEVPGMYRPPRTLISGTSQEILFELPPRLSIAQSRMLLNARATSQLPVRYYVARGPAVIRNNELIIQQVPKRARFPMEIEVVAYQTGSVHEPKVAPAAISRILILER